MAQKPIKLKKGKAMGMKKVYYAKQFFITEANLIRKNKTNKKKRNT